MASPSLEYLNNVWQYVPQGHEKALKQAFYNTAANIFLVAAAAAVIAVYFVFSPFIRPLCWALLCGTFLYPFKRSLTNTLRGWLKGLSSSGTPFFVGLVILPVQVVTSTTDTLSDAIWNHVGIILAVLAGLPLLHLLYHFGPVYTLAQGLLSVLDFLYNFLDYFSAFWVYTMVVAYIIVVAVYWRPESRRMLSRLAIPVWVSVVLHMASAAGLLRVPLLLVLITMMVVGFMAEIKQASQKETAAEGGAKGSPTMLAARALFGWRSTASEGEGEAGVKEEKSEDSGAGTIQLETGPVLKPTSTPSASSTSSVAAGTIASATSASKPTSLGVKDQGQASSGTDSGDGKASSEEETSFSVRCFQALLWAHVLVRLWMHLWLILILLLLPLLHLGIKRLGGMCLVKEVWSRISNSVGTWLSARQEVLAPRSVRGIGKLLMRGDRKFIGVLEGSLDSATSTLMILALLIGTFIFTIIGFVQIQRESMYIISVSSNVFNNTVNQDLSQWLPDAPAMQDTMDSMVGKAYIYGRTFLTTKVRELLSGDEHANVTQVEMQVLEVWDQIYDKWFSKNATSKTPPLTMPEVGDVWALWDMVSQGQLLNVSKITAFAQENVGTFVSVLESVWSVVRSNMNLVMSILTSTLSIVFGGGTAILNFVVSAAIFLTTLFYLLAFSGSQYKPVEFFTSISPSLGSGSTPSGATSSSAAPTAGSRFGQAVEQAISGVFMASLKMSAFYGLWTWLVHLVFGLDIVFIPSALAAVFAAIPFVGAYWACLPGVVDLWLVQGQGLAAIACFLAHMVPAYVVDTAIYSEIKEGHPFLTGLAIAGGMYCMGLEGAILGPILLCCLIVLINMYGNMLRSDTPTSGH